MTMNRFPALVQGFFLERLMTQRNASPATVSAYRDTFRLLLRYLADQQQCPAAAVTMDMLNADTILAFLDDLEVRRQNSIKTRNHRLAAIHSFMDYVSFQAPEYLGLVQRVKQIPFKKAANRVVSYLVPTEMDALLGVCAVDTWLGRRDRLMLTLLYNTGMRVSELTGLTRASVILTPSGVRTVRIWGKGRKERVLPLWQSTQGYLTDWLREQGESGDPHVFTNRRGQPLTRSGVMARLQWLAQAATPQCPSVADKRVTPHVIRHTTAMHLLQSGIDLSTIAIWLGHESIETTHKYMVADLQLKERALAKTASPQVPSGRYQPSDDILAFLAGL